MRVRFKAVAAPSRASPRPIRFRDAATMHGRTPDPHPLRFSGLGSATMGHSSGAGAAGRGPDAPKPLLAILSGELLNVQESSYIDAKPARKRGCDRRRQPKRNWRPPALPVSTQIKQPPEPAGIGLHADPRTTPGICRRFREPWLSSSCRVVEGLACGDGGSIMRSRQEAACRRWQRTRRAGSNRLARWIDDRRGAANEGHPEKDTRGGADEREGRPAARARRAAHAGGDRMTGDQLPLRPRQRRQPPWARRLASRACFMMGP